MVVFALALDLGRACAVDNVEQRACRDKTLGREHRQVFDIGVILAVFLFHADKHLVFFTVFGVGAGFKAAYSDVVHDSHGLQGDSVVGERLAVGNKLDFGLAGFVAQLYVDDAGNVLNLVHEDFRSLEGGIDNETVHFEHDVSTLAVAHFGDRGHLDRDVCVGNVGEVGAQRVDNVFGTAVTAFAALEQFQTNFGGVRARKAVFTTDGSVVALHIGNVLDAAFDNLRYAIRSFDVRTDRHFDGNEDLTLILLGHEFDGEEVESHEGDECKQCAHAEQLREKSWHGKAKTESL